MILQREDLIENDETLRGIGKSEREFLVQGSIKRGGA
jgi:hypothetical protein